MVDKDTDALDRAMAEAEAIWTDLSAPDIARRMQSVLDQLEELELSAGADQLRIGRQRTRISEMAVVALRRVAARKGTAPEAVVDRLRVMVRILYDYGLIDEAAHEVLDYDMVELHLKDPSWPGPVTASPRRRRSSR